MSFPPPWTSQLAGYVALPQTIGMSGAEVIRLEAPGQPTLFAKSEPIRLLAELPGEAARLRWLATTGIPCPAVLDAADHAGRHYLLTSAVAGQNLATDKSLPTVLLLATVLRRLHSLDIASCPFDHRAEPRLLVARARIEAGLAGEGDFGEVANSRPDDEDLVVTHGDACLPNVLANASGFTGFVDCGRLGVADRYQDLALTCWSLGINGLGTQVPDFLSAYGIDKPDEQKLRWYKQLDDFF